MNGHPGKPQLRFVPTVKAHIGIDRDRLKQNPQKTRRWIYGLFDKWGFCQYVGLTANPKRRLITHRTVTGSEYSFRLIRETDYANGSRLELQIVRGYQRRGEANRNWKNGEYTLTLRKIRISTD